MLSQFLSRRVRDSSGRILCRIPPPSCPDYSSSFVFALPKSGSTMIAHIVRDLCSVGRVRYISIPDQLFRRGVELDALPPEIEQAFEAEGYCYGGFRRYPCYRNGAPLVMSLIENCRKILLVRDPRDMLVSHYYSMLYSHPKPGGARRSMFEDYRNRVRAMDIDTYCLEHAKFYSAEFDLYESVAQNCNTKIIRYEDWDL
jgi:hypothetical protein